MSENQEYLRLLDASKVHTSVFERKFMYLSDIIDPVYHEYAVRLERYGHSLDLDVIRPHHQVENYAEIARILSTYFEFALKIKEKSSIVISMSTGRSGLTDIKPVEYFITLKDSGAYLKLEQRERFAMMGAKIKTRVGFGTTLSIPIKEPYDKI